MYLVGEKQEVFVSHPRPAGKDGFGFGHTGVWSGNFWEGECSMKKRGAGEKEDGKEASNHDDPQLRRGFRRKQAPTRNMILYAQNLRSGLLFAFRYPTT